MCHTKHKIELESCCHRFWTNSGPLPTGGQKSSYFFLRSVWPPPLGKNIFKKLINKTSKLAMRKDHSILTSIFTPSFNNSQFSQHLLYMKIKLLVTTLAYCHSLLTWNRWSMLKKRSLLRFRSSHYLNLFLLTFCKKNRSLIGYNPSWFSFVLLHVIWESRTSLCSLSSLSHPLTLWYLQLIENPREPCKYFNYQ